VRATRSPLVDCWLRVDVAKPTALGPPARPRVVDGGVAALHRVDADLAPRPGDTLHVIPPERAPWRALRRHRTVLANLHGATVDPRWYGDLHGPPLRRRSSPRTLPAASLLARSSAPRRASAPSSTTPALAAGRSGLATAWLAAGAVALVGSTTTSYGGADETLAADLLVRFWLAAVLDGASTGRALLQARQQMAAGGELDPVDLKTLAQFVLLGDPSVHPVRATGVPGPVAGGPVARAARRSGLTALGSALDASVVRASGPARRRPLTATTADVDAARRLAAAGASVRTVTARVPGEPGAAARFHLVGGAGAPGRELVVVREAADGTTTSRRLVAR
jgi:hypothetical protein